MPKFNLEFKTPTNQSEIDLWPNQIKKKKGKKYKLTLPRKKRLLENNHAQNHSDRWYKI